MVQSNYGWDYEPLYGAAAHPPCEPRSGLLCESCDELTEIEAQIEDLHSQLKDLHERHRQARVKRNHVHSVIRQVPLEIVAYIFTLAFPPRDTPPCCSSVAPGQTSLILTKICHTWRVLALSTPRLWCDISVNVNEPNLALLNLQIPHSGMVPLSIYLFAFSSNPSPPAEEAISLVIKQLHRTALLFFRLSDYIIRLFCFLSDMDHQKAAPLLEELHVHGTGTYEVSYLPLRLAIEPPSPRRVVLGSLHYNQISLNWNNISSATLCGFDGLLPLLGKNLEHLTLSNYYDESIPVQAERPLVVNQWIQELTLGTLESASFMLTATSLPSLRVLEIHVNFTDLLTLPALCCVFLRRSLCPLQVLKLDIHDLEWGPDFASDTDTIATRAIQALTDVLENTNMLRQLSLRLMINSWFLSSRFEPLVQRFRQKSFLPCLQILHIITDLASGSSPIRFFEF